MSFTAWCPRSKKHYLVYFALFYFPVVSGERVNRQYLLLHLGQKHISFPEFLDDTQGLKNCSEFFQILGTGNIPYHTLIQWNRRYTTCPMKYSFQKCLTWIWGILHLSQGGPHISQYLTTESSSSAPGFLLSPEFLCPAPLSLCHLYMNLCYSYNGIHRHIDEAIFKHESKPKRKNFPLLP